MRLVVDTNIVFSAVLNSDSRIARILVGSGSRFTMYSCHFLEAELLKHRSKLRRLTKLSEDDLDEVIAKATRNIRFIHEETIPATRFADAERLLEGNDLKDAPFVALALHLDAQLWTGDKRLVKRLPATLRNKVVDTARLLEWLTEQP